MAESVLDVRTLPKDAAYKQLNTHIAAVLDGMFTGKVNAMEAAMQGEVAFTGFGMARVRNNARNSSLALVWSATLFAGVTIWVRNIVGYALKVAVWPIIGLWLIQRLVVMIRGRAMRRPAQLASASADPFTL